MILRLLILLIISSTAYTYEHEHFDAEITPKGDCANNYLMPNKKARLGSHSFIIIGKLDKNHLLLDHRSGTPPHNYHYILKLKVDNIAMTTYEKLLAKSTIGLPAITTIDFDKNKKQVGRSFFCLQDLPKIFGHQKKKSDEFEKLFPIRATWQLNADFEASFKIGESIVPEEARLIINRDDVEILLYRYHAPYLKQDDFRKYIQEQKGLITRKLSHIPISFNESEESASKHSSFFKSLNLSEEDKFQCPADFYLKNYKLPTTPHAFLIFKSDQKNLYYFGTLYEQSPLNFQTWFEVKLNEAQSKLVDLSIQNNSPALFITKNKFCMAKIKSLIKENNFEFNGEIYSNNQFSPFVIGKHIAPLKISSKQSKLLTNRILYSLLDPQLVARDELGFVDIKTIIPNILVEARYNTNWNFMGRKVSGYKNNSCILSKAAAIKLAKVQADLNKQGYSLLVFDCYRPQRAVNEFVRWAKDISDTKMKSIFYPEVKKSKLVPEYIDDKSGHSRGSVVDLSIVKLSKYAAKNLQFKEDLKDCRKLADIEKTGQLNMGTSFDCFSTQAHTASNKVSKEAMQNRNILKSTMLKHGFINYPKEWWHFILKEEAYPNQYFDFEVY